MSAAKKIKRSRRIRKRKKRMGGSLLGGKTKEGDITRRRGPGQRMRKEERGGKAKRKRGRGERTEDK